MAFSLFQNQKRLGNVAPTREAAISYNDLHDRAVDLLREYGDGASYQAALKADEALARGDGDAQRIWMGVLKLVEQIDRIDAHAMVQ